MPMHLSYGVCSYIKSEADAKSIIALLQTVEKLYHEYIFMDAIVSYNFLFPYDINISL